MDNVREYFQLLAELGIDPEQEMARLERKLQETKGQVHSFRSGGGLRVLRLEKDDKLVNYGESFNFENGLKKLFEDLKLGDRFGGEYEGKYLTGVNTPSSPIDQWVLMGNTIDIKTENGGGFVVGAGDHDSDRNKSQLFEVSAKNLITAFEWFNRDMPELNQLAENRMAKFMMCGKDMAGGFNPQYTVRYEVQESDRARVRAIERGEK